MLMTTYQPDNTPGRRPSQRRALARRGRLDYCRQAEPAGAVAVANYTRPRPARAPRMVGEISTRQLRYYLPWQMRYPAAH